MVVSMATRKVTVTVEVSQLERIRSLVEQGLASSVSGFVQHAVGIALDDLSGWEAVLDEGLAATGGGLTDDERAWADRILGTDSADVSSSVA
jgi:Arc/MetJ-type ribon-helix-helix transcriptional regulator